MRLKTIALLALVIVFVITLQGVKAHAASAWYYCAIKYMGVNKAGIPIVKLAEENGVFTKNFIIPADNEKEILAILLTAVSTEKMVRVNLDINNPYSLAAVYLYPGKDVP